MEQIFNKNVEWNYEKNEWLISERNISFEELVVAAENNKLLDIVQNDKYPGQKIMVVEINNYVYLCPFIEENDRIFLKTIYPSRKLTKIYLKEARKEDEE